MTASHAIEMLSEEKMEELMRALHANARAINPYVIVIPPQMWVTAGHMAFYQRPVRKIAGARKRKLALYWR